MAHAIGEGGPDPAVLVTAAAADIHAGLGGRHASACALAAAAAVNADLAVVLYAAAVVITAGSGETRFWRASRTPRR